MTKIFILIGTAIAGLLAILGIVSTRTKAKGFQELSDPIIDDNNNKIAELEKKKQEVEKEKTTTKKRVYTKKQNVSKLEEKKKQPVKRNAPAKKNLKSDIVSKTKRPAAKKTTTRKPAAKK